jgi:hypothetical protein
MEKIAIVILSHNGVNAFRQRSAKEGTVNNENRFLGNPPCVTWSNPRIPVNFLQRQTGDLA